MSKSYIVRENPDGTRYFDENTPTGQISPDTIGAGLKIDDDGKVAVDDEKYVHITGDETITGAKTFTSVPVMRGTVPHYRTKITDIERGVTPASTKSTYPVTIVDKNDNVLSRIYCQQNNVGHNRLGVSVSSKDGSITSFLYLGMRDDDTAYTYSPTPPLTDKSTQIATTEWVKNVLPTSNGFKVNPDGTVSVDFSAMGTDTINAIKKELGVKIPLTSSKNFYVNDSTGSDTLDEGRGETADKPFKTIQACIDYVTSTYDFSGYTLNIMLANGTYSERMLNFKSITGGGLLNIYGNNRTNCIVKSNVQAATGVSGNFALRRLTLQSYGEPYGSNSVEAVIGNSSANANVTLRDCSIDLVPVTRGGLVVFSISDSGSVTLDYVSETISSAGGIIINAAQPVSGLRFIQVTRSGSAMIREDITFTGDFTFTDSTVIATSLGLISMARPTLKSSTPVVSVASGSVTAVRYKASGNGIINCGTDQSYFPGNAPGATNYGGQYY